jgi:phosphopantothenoylcysteine decarboxylase/phosphopantothenate--cysteine ligase
MSKNILLGVSGSIAAYKAADLVSRLIKQGDSVKVVMTKNAAEFIKPLTFQTLSQNKVYLDEFSDSFEIDHISLGKWADLAIIAPSTANVITKIAVGLADDLLSTTFLSFTKTKFIAPAMNTAMYENPAIQSNLEKLRFYGYTIIEPRESRLACGDVGKGAMAAIETIIEAIECGKSI